MVNEKNTNIGVNLTDKSAIKQKHKLFPELDYLKAGYSLQLAPLLQIINSKLAYMVTATTADGIKIKSYYDTKSGLKLREFIDAPGSSAEDFTDYNEVGGGVKIPYTEKTTYLDEAVDFKVKEVKVNTGLPDNDFK